MASTQIEVDENMTPVINFNLASEEERRANDKQSPFEESLEEIAISTLAAELLAEDER